MESNYGNATGLIMLSMLGGDCTVVEGRKQLINETNKLIPKRIKIKPNKAPL